MWELFVGGFDLPSASLVGGLVGLLAATAVAVLRDLHPPSRAATVTFAWALAASAAALLLAAVHVLGDHFGSVRAPAALSAASAALTLLSVILLFEPERPAPAWLGHAGAALVLLVLVMPEARHALLLGFALQALALGAAWVVLLRHAEPAAPFGHRGLTFAIGLMGVGAIGELLDLAMDGPGDPARHVLFHGLWTIPQTLASAALMVLYVSILYGRLLGEARRQAVTDDLTGLSSRRDLFARGDPWLAERGRGAGFTALMMIDVDDFKSINDRFGHDVGDQVLRHVAQVLRDALRADTILARYGGEEFCALVPVQNQHEAEAVAERVRAAVEQRPFARGASPIEATVSIGVAFHRAGLTLREVLRTADSRVYCAKATGRNRVVGEAPVLQAAIV